jgi:hypothetical protein
METKLIEQRKPTPAEKAKGAEVIFIREDKQGRQVTIMACKCHESWEQWGAHTGALSDNCEAVDRWRAGRA